MKHTANVTAVLILIFIVTQMVGLTLINIDIKAKQVNAETGEVTLTHSENTEQIRPQTKGFGSFIYLALGVAIGTFLVLVLMRFNKVRVWRFWFLLAVFISIDIALTVIFPSLIALFIALGLALWKILKPNIFVHNITEILMYAGIGVLLIPIFNLFWVFMVLIAISIYDMIAVWQSKHMIKMAQFQTKSNVFAGLMIPYKEGKIMNFGKPQKTKLTAPTPSGTKTAILGGGDIAFPLLFSGVVMESLIKGSNWLTQEALSKSQAFSMTMIITLFSAAALMMLFIFAKKDRFYPAMPFISAGCFLGFVVVKLILGF